jgi:glycosyltransferase involved in cell wall biosynthesis
VRMDRNQVVVAWSGLPWYAARLLHAGYNKIGRIPTVLGTLPEVPMKGMEDTLGAPILWLRPERRYTWRELNLPVPGLFVHTAWNIPAFLSLARAVHREGGAVVGMIDNNYKGSLRQFLGAVAYRSWLREHFAAVWVPGRSGRRFMRLLGMPHERIHEGLYGADPTVFTPGPPVSQRTKEILFVGQLIERKGVRELLRAFRTSGLAEKGWKLRIVGSGPLRTALEGHVDVIAEEFQPEATVAARMRAAQIFVLPSHEEHWGMVLAEAGLSGCVLVASDRVGATEDLVRHRPQHSFRAGAPDELRAALLRLAACAPDELDALGGSAHDAAAQFGPARWALVFQQLTEKYLTRAGTSRISASS